MADAATWAKRVAEWRDSGQVAREFCEGRDFNAKGLLWWSSFLGRKSRTASAFPIAQVVVRASREKAAPSVDTGTAVVVEMAGARVFIGAGVSRETLELVLDVLAGRAQ